MTSRQNLVMRMRLSILVSAVLVAAPIASLAADCCDLPNGTCIGPIDQLSCEAEFGGTYAGSLTCEDPQMACQAEVPAVTPAGGLVLGGLLLSAATIQIWRRRSA